MAMLTVDCECKHNIYTHYSTVHIKSYQQISRDHFIHQESITNSLTSYKCRNKNWCMHLT